MVRTTWPLVGLLISDIYCIWSIFVRSLHGSITDAIEGAYIACGVTLVQLLLCVVGLSAARAAKLVLLAKIYTGHIFLSLVLCVIANVDMT